MDKVSEHSELKNASHCYHMKKRTKGDYSIVAKRRVTPIIKMRNNRIPKANCISFTTKAM